MNYTIASLLILRLVGVAGPAQPASPTDSDKPWPAAKAWAWYEKVGVVKGFNYVPGTAINLLEWWQADTFDPRTIDRKLRFARDAGYNSVRANLSQTVWEADPAGLKKRVDTFLTLAHKHRISVMLCLFDDVNFAKANPHPGLQPAPKPHIHNSRWVPSARPTGAVAGQVNDQPALPAAHRPAAQPRQNRRGVRRNPGCSRPESAILLLGTIGQILHRAGSGCSGIHR